MRRLVLICLAVLLLPVMTQAAAPGAYPFDDPYEATVFGTPPNLVYAIEKPVAPKLKSYQIKGRKVPSIFSYSSELFYSTLFQKGDAPLIFIIAGTGAEHDSSKMRFLSQVFYQAGFHVVALSSPTHMNFVISASEHGAPGYVPYDVNDLYRIMLWIKEDIAKDRNVTVTDYSITGYSLGALHAAFLTHMDSEKGDFNFRRTLMINPPVSLYHSVVQIDSWLTSKNLGDRSVRDQVEHFVNLFSDYYKNADVTDLDDDFLYDMVTKVDMTGEDLRALIAVDFRMSLSSMMFSADVCLEAGYLVPPADYPLGNGKPLLPYAEEAFNLNFQMYMDEFLLPYLQFLEPGMDRYTMLQKCSLYDIRSYLKETDKILVLGNRDDVILDENDFAFIDSVFGKRARMFPTGGHCGNMMYPTFVEAMLAMVKP